MSSLRLVFVPVLITALVSGVRLFAEVQGLVPPQSGGALHPLGISWFAFAFGGWFGLRLRQEGSRPQFWPAWPWALIAFAAVVASIGWQFGPLLEADRSDETFARLRAAVLTLVGVASTMAAGMFVLWPRLAFTLLLYALPSRAIVVGITWLAKQQGWHTHYTKFGPPGLERDMSETMISAAIAQGGFWTPFTIVCGCVCGTWFGKKR